MTTMPACACPVVRTPVVTRPPKKAVRQPKVPPKKVVRPPKRVEAVKNAVLKNIVQPKPARPPARPRPVARPKPPTVRPPARIERMKNYLQRLVCTCTKSQRIVRLPVIRVPGVVAR